MASSRTEIFRIPVDAVGTPDIIQLADGVGPYQNITASLETDSVGWTLYAPNSNSSSKTFSIGGAHRFENGPYRGLDVLGYVDIPSGANFLILICER